MRQKVYNFGTTTTVLKNDEDGEEVITRDYFDFYHTGIEKIVEETPNLFFQTERFEDERSEIIAYNLFNNADLSDVILAINNDVYWWDTPIDQDTRELVAKNYLYMIEKIKKRPLLKRPKYDSKEEEENDTKYYDYDHLEDIVSEKLGEINSNQKSVILPKYSEIQRVIRLIKKYTKARKVT